MCSSDLKSDEDIIVFYAKQPIYNPQMTIVEKYKGRNNTKHHKELTGLDLETERQLIEASDYRRFTQQFGVRDPKPDNRPRIHRYVRSWTLPRSTVDTATGMPRASFGWDLALRMEKGHRMKEHSLVLVLGAWRPLMLNAITPWSFIRRIS